MLSKRSKKLVLALSTITLLIPAHVLAGSGYGYIGASIAGSVAHIGNNSPQISYLSGVFINDAYPLNRQTSWTSTFSVNGGYELPGCYAWPAMAIGVGIYSGFADYHYHGSLVETATGNLASTLYHYRYDVASTRTMIEAKFTWPFDVLSPFIEAGVGPTWNKMNSYSEVAATYNGYTALPPFRNHTNVNFAYQVGVGISGAFNFDPCKTGLKHERISLGYRYVNLGNTAFSTRGAAYPYTLNTGHLSTNDIYLSYTHLF